jgi:hypothetical protein
MQTQRFLDGLAQLHLSAAARIMLGCSSRLKGAAHRSATAQPRPGRAALDPRASAANSGRHRGQAGHLPTPRAPLPQAKRHRSWTSSWS